MKETEKGKIKFIQIENMDIVPGSLFTKHLKDPNDIKNIYRLISLTKKGCEYEMVHSKEKYTFKDISIFNNSNTIQTRAVKCILYNNFFKIINNTKVIQKDDFLKMCKSNGIKKGKSINTYNSRIYGTIENENEVIEQIKSGELNLQDTHEAYICDSYQHIIGNGALFNHYWMEAFRKNDILHEVLIKNLIYFNSKEKLQEIKIYFTNELQNLIDKHNRNIFGSIFNK